MVCHAVGDRGFLSQKQATPGVHTATRLESPGHAANGASDEAAVSPDGILVYYLRVVVNPSASSPLHGQPHIPSFAEMLATLKTEHSRTDFAMADFLTG